jgi:REP element-mobilizing transposase RayT
MQNFPHGSGLRKGRVSIGHQVYLVTTVTCNRQPLFQDLHAGRKVVETLRYASDKGNAETLAYVVMPDHIHWLLSLGENAALSRLVGTMKRHSARRINELNRITGRCVWQRGFHDHALRSDESLPAVARYIVANPLRARLVKRIGDYPLWDAVWL